MACWWRGPSPRWAASESPSPGPILIQPHVPSSLGLDCSNNSPLSQAWIMQTLSNLNIKWIKGGRSYQQSRKLQDEREISLKPLNIFINTAGIMLKIWVSFKTVNCLLKLCKILPDPSSTSTIDQSRLFTSRSPDLKTPPSPNWIHFPSKLDPKSRNFYWALLKSQDQDHIAGS